MGSLRLREVKGYLGGHTSSTKLAGIILGSVRLQVHDQDNCVELSLVGMYYFLSVSFLKLPAETIHPSLWRQDMEYGSGPLAQVYIFQWGTKTGLLEAGAMPSASAGRWPSNWTNCPHFLGMSWLCTPTQPCIIKAFHLTQLN